MCRVASKIGLPDGSCGEYVGSVLRFVEGENEHLQAYVVVGDRSRGPRRSLSNHRIKIASHRRADMCFVTWLAGGVSPRRLVKPRNSRGHHTVGMHAVFSIGFPRLTAFSQLRVEALSKAGLKPSASFISCNLTVESCCFHAPRHMQKCAHHTPFKNLQCHDVTK